MEDPFNIKVDLTGDGQPVEVLVIPDENIWVLVLDGVEIGKIETDGEHDWCWIESALDKEAACRIGEKIECYYL